MELIIRKWNFLILHIINIYSIFRTTAMNKLLYYLIAVGFLSSCHTKQQKAILDATIDSTLQVKATSILESKLSELKAQSGQAIIMEVQTGQIKALVGKKRQYQLPTLRELYHTKPNRSDTPNITIGSVRNWESESI